MTNSILVVGGLDSIGAAVVEHFGPPSLGISRRNGYDVSDAKVRRKIVELSLDFPLVLSHAHSGHFEGQTMLLYELYEAWAAAGKRGTIFHTGSSATYDLKEKYARFAVIKYAGDVACRQIAKAAQAGLIPFRVTNLRVGTLDTPASRARPQWPGHGVSAETFIRAMEFVIGLPENVCVPELVLQAGPIFQHGIGAS